MLISFAVTAKLICVFVFAFAKSFEQTIMDPSPQCYIPGFVEIGTLVAEKNIFEGSLLYYGHGDHFGHVTKLSFFLWRLKTKFGFDWPSGFGEGDVWKL